MIANSAADSAADIVLLSTGPRVGHDEIEALEPGAAAKIRGLLGPSLLSHSFPATTRTAEVLRRGAILLTENGGEQLLSLVVCFDEQASPYSAFRQVPVFSGTVKCAGHRFFGRERVTAVKRLEGVYGFGGVLKLDLGRLHLGLHFKKPLDRFGKRVGEGELVRVVAEWGGVKGFGGTRRGVDSLPPNEPPNRAGEAGG